MDIDFFAGDYQRYAKLDKKKAFGISGDLSREELALNVPKKQSRSEYIEKRGRGVWCNRKL